MIEKKNLEDLASDPQSIEWEQESHLYLSYPKQLGSPQHFQSQDPDPERKRNYFMSKERAHIANLI